MFKSILLAVDASKYSEVCTVYALEYAHRLGAKITALSVLDHKEIAIVYPYFYPTVDFPPVFDESIFEKHDLFDKQKKRAIDVLHRIETKCQEANVGCSKEIRDGLVSEIILEETQTADLLFAGQRGAGADYSTGLLGSNLESVIRRSSIPVIITPQKFRPLKKILVCFDGSDYAAKSLRAAVHLAVSCPEGNVALRLLVVGDDDDAAQAISSKAVKYLDAYQIGDIFIHRRGDVATGIIETADTENADLVTMGAYGHSRIRELVLGSTTETVLRNIHLPVLLHH